MRLAVDEADTNEREERETGRQQEAEDDDHPEPTQHSQIQRKIHLHP